MTGAGVSPKRLPCVMMAFSFKNEMILERAFKGKMRDSKRSVNGIRAYHV